MTHSERLPADKSDFPTASGSDNPTVGPPGSRRRRWVVFATLLIGPLLAARVLVEITPRPAAAAMRFMMDQGAARTSAALEKHVPHGSIEEQSDQKYDEQRADGLLDVYRPADRTGQNISPTVVWVHGGGWISGSRKQVANYLRIIASKGFTVVGVDYGLAPSVHYPTPVRQVNAALGYLRERAEALRLDADRFVLAGDSAGAQIVAQLAAAISAERYARALELAPTIDRSQLAGVVLHCGVYDLGVMRPDGLFAIFAKTLLWTYTGRKDFWNDPRARVFSVRNHVGPEFPPTFISVGTADPLRWQSYEFATTLQERDVPVTPLFFDDGGVALRHEYQFNLDSTAGKQALEETVEFLGRL